MCLIVENVGKRAILGLRAKEGLALAEKVALAYMDFVGKNNMQSIISAFMWDPVTCMPPFRARVKSRVVA